MYIYSSIFIKHIIYTITQTTPSPERGLDAVSGVLSGSGLWGVLVVQGQVVKVLTHAAQVNDIVLVGVVSHTYSSGRGSGGVSGVILW